MCARGSDASPLWTKVDSRPFSNRNGTQERLSAQTPKAAETENTDPTRKRSYFGISRSVGGSKAMNTKAKGVGVELRCKGKAADGR